MIMVGSSGSFSGLNQWINEDLNHQKKLGQSLQGLHYLCFPIPREWENWGEIYTKAPALLSLPGYEYTLA